MQVLPTLHSGLLRLHAVPTIRITWDICVAAIVKKFAGFLIASLNYGTWDGLTFKVLLYAALLGFFISECRVILKHEVGFSLKKIRKDLAGIRKPGKLTK